MKKKMLRIVSAYVLEYLSRVYERLSRKAIFSSGLGELVHRRWDWTLGVELALKHNEQDQMREEQRSVVR